jgi:ParB-like chromosome segregation protein Spo0J
MTITSPNPLAVTLRDPHTLVPAPWNPNRATPEDERKLDESIRRFGMFKPVICRELPTGALQILGGHYRVQAALRLGISEVPVINLGTVDDRRAKEITLIDNGRYGRDDTMALAGLLEELGSPTELALFMPYDLVEIDAICAASKIDLETLGLVEEPEEKAIEDKPARAPKTHEILRLKVALEDAERVRRTLETIMQAQGFTDSDALTNAGDALVWLINDWLEQTKGEG